jgi:putative proteasome-type protease
MEHLGRAQRRADRGRRGHAMTFCLGMKCREGLLAIADTRITSGTELSTAKKISVHQYSQHSMFLLTSGLRSLRDKATTYFEERLRQGQDNLDRMYLAANALADEIRRVRIEDKQWLTDSGLFFDLHCIFGGQLAGDDDAHLYLIYPEGNWVEVRTATPYVIIGESRYGKPILDRVWRYQGGLRDALRIGLLSFDATKTSASDVDYPVDAVMYRPDTYQMQEQRFSGEDLEPLRRFWQRAIEEAASATAPVVEPLYARLENAPPARTHYDDNGYG